jgi:hypothetical protein
VPAHVYHRLRSLPREGGFTACAASARQRDHLEAAWSLRLPRPAEATGAGPAIGAAGQARKIVAVANTVLVPGLS